MHHDSVMSKKSKSFSFYKKKHTTSQSTSAKELNFFIENTECLKSFKCY